MEMTADRFANPTCKGSPGEFFWEGKPNCHVLIFKLKKHQRLEVVVADKLHEKNFCFSCCFVTGWKLCSARHVSSSGGGSGVATLCFLALKAAAVYSPCNLCNILLKSTAGAHGAANAESQLLFVAESNRLKEVKITAAAVIKQEKSF